jgi:hypothetical protein
VPDTGVRMSIAFAYLDLYGSPRRTAEAAIELNTGESMTVRAGGAGVRACPAGVCGPYTAYEVMLDHEPPRFWTRYGSDPNGIVFAQVPGLLITHYITRRGGISRISCGIKVPVLGTFKVSVIAPRDAGRQICQSIAGVKSATLSGLDFVME